MDNFSTLQLKRACYVALLEENKLESGISFFYKYMKKLNLFAFNLFNIKKIIEEKRKAKKVLIEILSKKAEEYFKQKQYSDALLCYENIFSVDKKNIENLKKYIDCLKELKQYDLALNLAHKLEKLTTKKEFLPIISSIYEASQDEVKAIEFYEKYVALLKESEFDVNKKNKLGILYFRLYPKTHLFEHAQKSYDYLKEVLKTDMNSKAYLKNMIFATRRLKKYEEEKKYWDIYFKNKYADKEDEFIYSSSRMLQGEIELWEEYYEARYQKENSLNKYPKSNKPYWNGEDLTDKTLFVHFEQGFGDTILMMGYMRRLVKLAKKVVFYVQDELYDLLKPNGFGVEIQSRKTHGEAKKDSCDYFILAMSIPKALKLNRENISVGKDYIKLDALKIKEWENKYFKTDKFKIGVAFMGNKKGNQNRDIPLKSLLKFDNLKNVQLYCLTKDVEDADLKAFKKNKVVNIAKDFNSFLDTALAMENMDLIVTSDSCILNLAGALGKKTFAAFNFQFEFRWYDLSGKDCGWFSSVVPFVNDKDDNWDLTIDKIIKEIDLINKNSHS